MDYCCNANYITIETEKTIYFSEASFLDLFTYGSALSNLHTGLLLLLYLIGSNTWCSSDTDDYDFRLDLHYRSFRIPRYWWFMKYLEKKPFNYFIQRQVEWRRFWGIESIYILTSIWLFFSSQNTVSCSKSHGFLGTSQF